MPERYWLAKQEVLHSLEGVQMQVDSTNTEVTHPKLREPFLLFMNILVAVLGAIIGVQIIVTLGVTPNTAIIGAIVAILVSRIPGQLFSSFRSVHRQNLM